VVSAHYKKDDLLNCWTGSLDIPGYHADFHEGHGTVGAGQGNGMLCVKPPLEPVQACNGIFFLSRTCVLKPAKSTTIFFVFAHV
jgi:hypothetical protein